MENQCGAFSGTIEKIKQTLNEGDKTYFKDLIRAS
jgi:hypothetical protein